MYSKSQNFETSDSQYLHSVNSDVGVAAALEARRLSEKHSKDFFDCETLVKILGVGTNNVRELMRSEAFPTVEIGNRRVVSAIAFAFWSLQQGRD
jgi:hypothetical protein